MNAILPDIGAWLAVGNSYLGDLIGSYVLKSLRIKIVLDQAGYGKVLSLIVFSVFTLVFLFIDERLLVHKSVSAIRATRATVIILGFTAIFFSAANDIARDKFITFKSSAICSKMDYVAYRDFQNRVYLSESYSDAIKVIDSKKCKE